MFIIACTVFVRMREKIFILFYIYVSCRCFIAFQNKETYPDADLFFKLYKDECSLMYYVTYRANIPSIMELWLMYATFCLIKVKVCGLLKLF